MSYALELARALQAVFERASELKAHRLAGYAANADFWLTELEHRFAMLDGYVERWKRMRDATLLYVAEHPMDPRDFGRDSVQTSRSTKTAELKHARRALAAAAEHFIDRSLRAGLLSAEQTARAEQLLGRPFSDAR